MRAARRQGVLEVVCCGTRSSLRVRARAPPAQHFLRGGYKRGLHAFQGGRRHRGRFGTPEEEKGGGGAGGSNCRRVSPGDAALGMLYADDAGVVSRSSEQLRKMMEVIVVVCAAFGLTVSEAKTEIMCLREGDAGVHRHIKRRGSGPGIRPDERVCIPRGKRQPQRRPVHRGRPAHTPRMVQLPEVQPRTVRPTERSPRARMLRAEVLETMLHGCVTRSPHACHYDTLHRLAKA